MAAPPDYMLDPDAVTKDVNAAWRHGGPPDYTKTRAFYKEGMSHPAAGLEYVN